MSVTIVGNNTPTAGSVVYGDGSNYASTAVGTSGQLLTSAGASTPTWTTVTTGATLGTVVATTSGTSAEFTGIPSTAKVVFVNFQAVSFVNGQQAILQLGTSSAYVATGYIGSSSYITNTGTCLSGGSGITNAWWVGYYSAPSTTTARTGGIILTLVNASTNLWVMQGNLADDSSGELSSNAGYVTLTNALTRLKVTASNGTTAFDAGSINISYI